MKKFYIASFSLLVILGGAGYMYITNIQGSEEKIMEDIASNIELSINRTIDEALDSADREATAGQEVANTVE